MYTLLNITDFSANPSKLGLGDERVKLQP